MLETISHLKTLQMKPPICIGIHAIFADKAYENLLSAGVKSIITCNTIPHISNQIDITEALTDCLQQIYVNK